MRIETGVFGVFPFEAGDGCSLLGGARLSDLAETPQSFRLSSRFGPLTRHACGTFLLACERHGFEVNADGAIVGIGDHFSDERRSGVRISGIDDRHSKLS